MSVDPLRCVPTTGDWTISIGPEFETIDNGDSWQAYDGSRVVYVSSIAVLDANGKVTPADSLRATAIRSFGTSLGERHSYSQGSLRGEAEVKPESGHWQLKGFMCATGTVATCVVDFPDDRDREWAVSTWRSLAHP